jgi:hypothetical protein
MVTENSTLRLETEPIILMIIGDQNISLAGFPARLVLVHVFGF